VPAKPACSHRRWCIVASDAIVTNSGGSDRAGCVVHWCPDCGAIRPEADGRRGPWLAPGSALVRDMLKKVRERRLDRARQGAIDA